MDEAKARHAPQTDNPSFVFHFSGQKRPVGSDLEFDFLAFDDHLGLVSRLAVLGLHLDLFETSPFSRIIVLRLDPAVKPADICQL